MYTHLQPSIQEKLAWMEIETTRMRAEFEVTLKKFKEFQQTQTQDNQEPR